MSTRSQELVGGIFYLILAVTAIALFFCYLSLSNSNSKLDHTKPDKLSSYFKVFAVFFFGLTIVFGAILRNFWPIGKDCAVFANISGIVWRIAITLQFLTWILYLYQCYPSDSKDHPQLKSLGYTVSNLSIVAGIIISFSVVIIVVLIIFIPDAELDIDADGEFPYYCSSTIANRTAQIAVGVSIMVWDSILSIGSIIAFRIPFNILLDKQHFQPDSAEYKRWVFTSRKYFICVTVSSSSEIIWVFIAIMGFRKFSILLAAVNFLVAMVCLMLMTPNYNEQWFKYLCCLCISTNKKTIPVETIRDAYAAINYQQNPTEMKQEDKLLLKPNNN